MLKMKGEGINKKARLYGGPYYLFNFCSHCFYFCGIHGTGLIPETVSYKGEHICNLLVFELRLWRHRIGVVLPFYFHIVVQAFQEDRD